MMRFELATMLRSRFIPKPWPLSFVRGSRQTSQKPFTRLNVFHLLRYRISKPEYVLEALLTAGWSASVQLLLKQQQKRAISRQTRSKDSEIALTLLLQIPAWFEIRLRMGNGVRLLIATEN